MLKSLLIVFVLAQVIGATSVYGETKKDEVRSEKVDPDKPWRLKKSDDKKKKKKKGPSDLKKFKSMARGLLGRPHWSDRFLNLLDSEIPKIAIHPFTEGDLPISLAEAQTYVDGFTRALIREADGRYAIVGRKELGAVIADINEIGTRSDSVNPLGDLIDRARSDLLAVGHLSLQGESIVLSYKLVETETGRIVSTVQKKFKRKKVEEEVTAGGLSLAGAARKAAYALMRDLMDVRKIQVQGLRYQTSGVHTSFGHYFMGLLSDDLRREAASGPRNFNDLEISDFIVEEERFRGLKITDRQSVEDQVLSEGGNDYLIKGTYWVFETYVDVRLTLYNQSGRSLAWRGRIVRSEIPENLDLLPPSSPIDEADIKPLGPMDLYLSSNKGTNPSYKVGQEMILVMRASQDAFVSCYYLQVDGAIFRIFPNDIVTSGKLPGGFTHYLPSNAMPFAFEFTPPRGVEAVKCFATDHDVSKAVGRQTGKAAFQPLGVANERELTKIYRSLPKTVLTEASLIVTVQ
ncbi:DUF4384 domain-containing protein [Terasakiella sp. A23]|uniref:DUF4384 domain-containing protein n=1 Tax=Terasakiella sp. FCG-A23 TaxID=3080561 RepID=UPI002953EAEE|nr:DUF4384 domain-containing protein [Terasakiella sp. A23]MDV7338953.1 DUF4384 domain-containing protein [Terasakiella sp. A23]